MDSRMRASLDRYITGNWGEDMFREPHPYVPAPIHCQMCGGFLTTQPDRIETVAETVDYQGEGDTALRWPVTVTVTWEYRVCARCGHESRHYGE